MNSPTPKRATRLLLAALIPATLLSGCAVGPQHPTTELSMSPAVKARNFSSDDEAIQTVRPGEATPPDWWTRFQSPDLDALVDKALAANEDLAVAQANLRRAQALAGVERGNAGPQVDVSLSSERTRLSDAIASPVSDPNALVYSLHTAQVAVTFPLDVFGLERSRIRSAVAQAQVARHQLLAARLTVADSVVVAAIAHASLAAQIKAAEESVYNNQRIADLLRRRQELGDVGLRDVAAQNTALAQAQAALPPLHRALSEQETILSTLLGIAPGNGLPKLPALDDLILPQDLPVALPAQIVSGRPDVRAAEAQMVAAGADVGAAIAARLPQFTIGANAGGSAGDITQMFASGNPFWTLLGGITAPIFHSGALKKQQQAAEATLEASKAQYRKAALLAFADVNNALTALHTDATALSAADRAADAATQTLTFTKRQAVLGSIDSLALLNASSQSAQALLALVQAKAARLTDTAALFQATGGGVETSPAPQSGS